MRATIAVGVLRWAGGLALLGSCGIVVCTIVVQAAGGVEVGQTYWPTPRLWRYFGTTLWMSAATTLLALVISLPTAFALIRCRRPWQRGLLLAITIIPLVTMPSIFAYAWLILASSRQPIIKAVAAAVGGNTPGAEPLQAAFVLAVWLWPIPAFVLASSFRHVGAGAFHLAQLDCSPVRAFFRAALPVMRAPLIAGCAIVFILASMDTVVSPLLCATETWSYEMLTSSGIALGYGRPAAYMFWQAWPLVATIGVLVIAAAPGLRQMARWSDEPAIETSGFGSARSGWVWPAACVFSAILALHPIAVFAVSLAGGRYTAGESMVMAWQTVRVAGSASLIVAVCSGLAGLAVGVAVVDDERWPLAWRIGGLLAVGLVLLVAVLPPPLIGMSLVAFFSNENISPLFHWNLYDHTPVPWIAALLARFAFIPVCFARLMNRRVPEETASLAVMDGAGRIGGLTHARLPVLWRGLAVASAVGVCLGLTEIAASSVMQPTQWIGRSLAVDVDTMMHYGRHNHTIALSLMMVLPGLLAGFLAALVGPLLAGRGRSRRGGDRSVRPPWRTDVAQQRSPTSATGGGRYLGGAAKRTILSSLLLVAAGATGCDGTRPAADDVKLVFGSAGRGDGEFNYPRGIAVSPVDGCVYVVDKSVPARIQRFSADGKFEHCWTTPDAKNGKPTGLYVDRENRVWVPDTHYARVICYDRDGREQLRFGSHGEGPGQFIFPTAVLVDRKGIIYVAEYGGNDRVSKFTPKGEYIGCFADKTSGEGWVDRPTEILMDKTGRLWVSDACNHRICRYDADGKFIGAFGIGGNEPGTYSFPYGMAFEADGNLLVADRGNNRIIRLNRRGEVLGTWGSQGRAEGQLLQPWGVAVAPGGRIYCLDSWNYRVQVIDW